MASSTTQRNHTFINLTDNPVEGKDERRTFVRRTVMSDYHKRRKRPTHAREAAVNQLLVGTDTPPAEPNGVSCFSVPTPVIGFKAAIIDPRSGGVDSSPESLDSLSRVLFRPKSWPDQQQAQTSRLITGFLQGQPLKAARNMSHVPFIHRRYRDMSGQGNMTSNPLTICGEVLRACVHDHDALWDSVREQQESIYSQIESFGRWKLLSAAQAVTLYILLWVKLGDSHGRFQHGNVALLFTLGKIYKFLQERHLHTDPKGSTLRVVRSWEDWIFQESCLRVATVYFLLTLLVETDMGFPCDGPTDWCIEKMPLPATKGSWEADSEVDWLAVTGESLDLATRPTFGRLFSNDGPWEEELDEMGLIVAMAGRLHAEISRA